jgi:lipopolysaccharide/colanic/teichoic acid biosynthesis glycosyltransferase
VRVLPIILDTIPEYLSPDGTTGSLLTLPAGSGTLIGEIVEAVGQVTAHRPMVLPLFSPGADYPQRIRAASGVVDRITTTEVLRDPLSHFEAADNLLLISPLCYPSDGLDLNGIVHGTPGSAGMTRHLLAFEATALRTKEVVHTGGDGRIRRIQRYFAPVTWPFPAGLIASYVPVSALLMSGQLPLDSLEVLRSALTQQGMASQDISYHGEFFDLTDEAGALTFVERRVLSAVRVVDDKDGADGQFARWAAESALRHPESKVHAAARIVGPVTIGAGAVVESGAMVIGPAAIGDGAHIGADAVVAQCFVAPHSHVDAGSTVRHVILSDVEGAPERSPRAIRHTSTVPARPEADPPPFGKRHLAIKAVLEVTIASLALIALSPLLITIAIIVKLTSRGPIFYGAPREGMYGRPFRCWKFRSMQTNADVLQKELAAQQQMDGPQFKMARDPRVTSIGRILRAANVDELPQLFNVVMMQMSLVGPRPSPFGENQICVPWRNARLSVRPGITGLWQICRHDRENGDFHQWIQYDLLYVRNASLLLDFKILVHTVLSLGGKTPVPLDRVIPTDARPIPADRRRRPHPESLAPLYRTPSSVPVVASQS